MRINLLTYGTRGDVQPYVVLARALARRGHTVQLAASEDAQALVAAAGLPFLPLAGSTRRLLESQEGRAMLASGRLSEMMRHIGAYMQSIRDALDDSLLAACRGADVVLGHLGLAERAASACEQLNVPLLAAHTVPIAPTRDFAHPMMNITRGGGTIRLASHWLVDAIFHLTGRRDQNHFRRKLGLPPLRRSAGRSLRQIGTPTFFLCSPELQARPADWDERWSISGEMTADPELRARLAEQSNGPLSEFIERGPAPFYLGFGSMPVLDEQATLRSALEALESIDGRAIVCAGWSDVPRDLRSERIFLTPAVDHEAILPRCAGAIHHGGAGTTHAAARAGRPSAVFSVFSDQPFWGRIVERLGVGVHQRFHDLNAASLAQVLRALSDPDRIQRARALGERMHAGRAPADVLAERLEDCAARAPVPRL